MFKGKRLNSQLLYDCMLLALKTLKVIMESPCIAVGNACVQIPTPA